MFPTGGGVLAAGGGVLTVGGRVLTAGGRGAVTGGLAGIVGAGAAWPNAVAAKADAPINRIKVFILIFIFVLFSSLFAVDCKRRADKTSLAGA